MQQYSAKLVPTIHPGVFAFVFENDIPGSKGKMAFFKGSVYHRKGERVLYRRSTNELGFRDFRIKTPNLLEKDGRKIYKALQLFAWAWNHRN